MIHLPDQVAFSRMLALRAVVVVMLLTAANCMIRLLVSVLCARLGLFAVRAGGPLLTSLCLLAFACLRMRKSPPRDSFDLCLL